MEKKAEKKILKIGLCRGRHEIKEVSDYFFENEIENPMDFIGLETIVNKKIDEFEYFDELHLYVTGLTPALIAVLNVVRNCKVVLYHFDRNNAEYKAQEMPMFERLAYLEDVTYGI